MKHVYKFILDLFCKTVTIHLRYCNFNENMYLRMLQIGENVEIPDVVEKFEGNVNVLSVCFFIWYLGWRKGVLFVIVVWTLRHMEKCCNFIERLKKITWQSEHGVRVFLFVKMVLIFGCWRMIYNFASNIGFIFKDLAFIFYFFCVIIFLFCVCCLNILRLKF